MPQRHSEPEPAPLGERRWLTALATSLVEEHDYRPRVEGTIPAGLRGTLYRNGPGLFERGDHRRSLLIDGDGMIQAFDFADHGVRFRNRFVRTEKFLREEAAGRAVYATWSRRAPGGWLGNLRGRAIRSQAGITVALKNGRLLAFDEVGRPYALDPESLETIGEHHFGGPNGIANCKAHTRTDAEAGDWILFGTRYGRQMTLQVEIRSADGALTRHFSVPAPRMVYLHDFLVTARYVVFVLHPVVFSPLRLLTGQRSFVECLDWRPELGNQVLVVDRDSSGPPVALEAPAAYMWHGLNAFERKGEIVAEFIGFDEPDHFLGPQAAFRTIMTGAAGREQCPGTLRRYLIDPNARTLRHEILAEGNHEFPSVDPRRSCHPHRFGYVADGPMGTVFLDGVARIDTTSGATERFRFGPGHHAGEPIFVPEPGGAPDAGWLLVEVLDGALGRSRLAVLRAEDPAAGPVAQVLLDHHVPLSFHGWWQPA